MRVYDLHDKEGRVFAFEVKNLFLPRWGLIWIVFRIPGARIVGEPSFSWFGPDAFCRFEVDGVEFEAWEPYGDSDAYWIGPEPVRWVPQLEKVREAFIRANPFGLPF